MQFVRLFFLMFVVLSIVYWLVSVYSRSVRTEKLEKRWDAEKPAGVDRDAYVRAGLMKYDSSLRKRLILLIYVLPYIFVFGAIYVTNYMGYR